MHSNAVLCGLRAVRGFKMDKTLALIETMGLAPIADAPPLSAAAPPPVQPRLPAHNDRDRLAPLQMSKRVRRSRWV